MQSSDKMAAARLELARTFAHWESDLKSNALTTSATLPTIQWGRLRNGGLLALLRDVASTIRDPSCR